MQLVLANVLVPASQRILSTRSAEIAQNVTARFLNAGQFMHPAKGITLFIREISPTGELLDLFLSDERGADARVIHTARKAFLVRGDTAPKLVMVDGIDPRPGAGGRTVVGHPLCRFHAWILPVWSRCRAAARCR